MCVAIIYSIFQLKIIYHVFTTDLCPLHLRQRTFVYTVELNITKHESKLCTNIIRRGIPPIFGGHLFMGQRLSFIINIFFFYFYSLFDRLLSSDLLNCWTEFEAEFLLID